MFPASFGLRTYLRDRLLGSSGESFRPTDPARRIRLRDRTLRTLPALALALASGVGVALADSVVVINEVMYHPAVKEPTMEWIELYNQNAVDVDLSGWRFSDGIDYQFPDNTVIKGRSYLVVAIDPAALQLTGATNVYGPFLGRLSNNGERIRLRDRNDRVMESFSYGVDGDWPVGPDGGGVSLAKRDPGLRSDPPENWTVSSQIGGTPGAANFSTAPILGPKSTVIPVDATWRFEDSGTDLGTAWRNPGFNDGSWKSGPGLFYFEDATLPEPKNTPLAPNRNTYYFRGTFQVAGNPADTVLSIRPIVDDGAVVYLNGTEVLRQNMPAGTVNYSTMALGQVADANYSGPFVLPSAPLVSGPNILAVEVHQTTVTTNAGLRVIGAAGYSIAWDGEDGNFFSAARPAPAPANAALASQGVEVFTTSNTNLAGAINDGRYGNDSAWAPAAGDALPTIILRFNQTIPISSVAWSRDNGDLTDGGCPGGTCADRALGNFTFQYTLNTNPAAITGNSSNPTNGWVTIATAQYLSAQPGFSPALRHRFDFTWTNGTIFATGIRLRVNSTNTIDEIEINPPAVAAFDAVFGAEVSGQEVLPPPPKLVFNELSGASPTNFWLEVRNASPTTVSLAGIQIVAANAPQPFEFKAGSLSPGAAVAVAQGELKFGASEFERLFLYTPGQSRLLDAVTVRAADRGRHPDGNGPWLHPAAPTPGASNVFNLRDDIVFNELMYKHRPFDPVPAVTTNRTAVPLTAPWRYNDSGTDLGTAWRQPGFNDSAWPAGTGLFAFNTGALPGSTNTTLAGGQGTYYFRTTFNFSGATSNLTIDLNSIVDDGAVFYLNGTEIFRQNMPTGFISAATSAAGAVADATITSTLGLPSAALVSGVNVLAVEVHQVTSATTSSGLVLSGGGLTLMEEGPFGGTVPMNLARRPGATPFVIDSLAGFPIHNYLGLTDGVYGNNNSWIGNSGNPGYAGVSFGGLFTINSLAFGRDNTGTYSDRTLGTYTVQYTRVASPGTATTVTGDPNTGWATIGTINYQNAGVGLFSAPARRHRFSFTPVEATGFRLLVPGTGIGSGTCIDELEVNPPDTSGDIAFGAELVLTTTLEPARPFTTSNEEWIELFNRAATDVDLTGWRLDAGIDFRFPTGTVIRAGSYLVVANDAASLKTKWPEVADLIVGDFSGNLSAGEEISLKDPAGNPVNAVRVHKGGWSDGGGSSLELVDPRADNGPSEAWTDSDESNRAAWQRVTYRMVAGQNYGSTRWNEFRIGLLDDGVVLLDDISVVRDPDGARQEVIQNGGFETTSGNIHWRFLGNHRCEIVGDPDNAANHVLKLTASGRAVMNHNHVETTFLANAPLVNGQVYEVSYRGRWVAGSPQVNTRGYFSKLARTTALPIPARSGTPGARNSRFQPNAGPTFAGLQHSPIIPPTNQPVTISVRVQDPDGIASVTLNYRVNPATAFTSLPMTVQADGQWAADIPGQAAGRVVHFYVTAVDQQGASAFAPATGPASRALYQVADAQGTTLPAHELRLIMLDADRDFMLANTNVMSNARNGATLIHNRTEIFYDVGARLQGTVASRIRDGDSYVSYDIDFPPDHLFRGVQNNIGIDRSGRGPTVRAQDEIYILHMFHRAGIPVPYSDLCYFISPRTVHTGTAILQLAGYGSTFVDEQYNQVGSVFNMDVTYEPDTTLVSSDVESPKLPVPHQAHIGTDFTDLGDKEQYRSPFDIRLENRRDDYAGLMRLCRVMALPQPQFDAQIGTVLNVDQALRMVAMEILCGIADTYISSSAGLPHNLRLITFADGDPAELLAWDMDFVFNAGTSSSIFLTTGFNLGKLMNNPATRRQYLYHVNDICQVSFNPTYMGPWLASYGAVVGQNYSAASTYITARRTYALTQLPAATPFAITSNGGNGFSVNTNFITLSGTSWIDVDFIEVNGIPYAPDWSTVTNWSFLLPLASGTNFLTVQGVDRTGAARPDLRDSIAITNTLTTVLKPVVINEWMADNIGPGGLIDPNDGFFQDWFELFNPNEVPVNLSGYHLTDNLTAPTKWVIPTNTIIPARGFLLVWADENGSQNSPTNTGLHANFRLSNGGEALGLFGPDGLSPQHAVSFGPQLANISEGLYPDGAVGTSHPMPNWTPAAPNQLGSPPAPVVTGIAFSTDEGTLTFTTLPARTYRIEFKDDLGAREWTLLQTTYTASGGTVSVNIPGGLPQQFYRIRLEQ